MRLDRKKIDLSMARKSIAVSDLAKVYGVSRARMHTIICQRDVTTRTAGRLAKALGVDVTEIMED